MITSTSDNTGIIEQMISYSVQDFYMNQNLILLDGKTIRTSDEECTYNVTYTMKKDIFTTILEHECGVDFKQTNVWKKISGHSTSGGDGCFVSSIQLLGF